MGNSRKESWGCTHIGEAVPRGASSSAHYECPVAMPELDGQVASPASEDGTLCTTLFLSLLHRKGITAEKRG